LKSYQHENNYELSLTQEGSNPLKLTLVNATQGTITALIPGNLAEGSYTLQLIHRYGQVQREFPAIRIRIVSDISL